MKDQTDGAVDWTPIIRHGMRVHICCFARLAQDHLNHRSGSSSRELLSQDYGCWCYWERVPLVTAYAMVSCDVTLFLEIQVFREWSENISRWISLELILDRRKRTKSPAVSEMKLELFKMLVLLRKGPVSHSLCNGLPWCHIVPWKCRSLGSDQTGFLVEFH